MYSTILGLLVAAFLAAANVAWADDATTTSPPAPQAASRDDPDTVVCRAGQKPVGSMLPGPRVCHTKREWNQIQEQARRNLEMQQNRGMEAGRPGG
jgi:hypothetical protein